MVLAAALALGGGRRATKASAMSPARRQTWSPRSPASSARSSTRPIAAGGRPASSAMSDNGGSGRQSVLTGRPFVQSTWSNRGPSSFKPGASPRRPGDPDSSYLIHKLEGSAGHRRAAHASHHRPLPHRRPDSASSAAGSSMARATTRRPDRDAISFAAHCSCSRSSALTVPAASAQTPAAEEEDPDLEVNVVAARLQSGGAAHEPAAAQGQVRVPHDAPLRAAARRGRLRRPASKTSSASTRARRSVSSCATGCSGARRSASTAPPIGPSSSSASTTSRASSRSRSASGSWGSIDGTNNFSDSYSPALGVIVSRELGTHGAVYARPDLGEQHQSRAVRAGRRQRTRSCSAWARGCASGPTVYVTAEVAPRLCWLRRPAMRCQLRRREARRRPRLRASTSPTASGRRWRQMARGGTANDDWYIGFNISRKFY